MNLDANLCLVAIISILYSICLDLTIFQGDTLTDLIHIVSCQVFIEMNVINLLLQELRVSKLRSQVTIVGQEKYTCCITVETAYRINTLRTNILYEVHHSLALLRIIAGCNIILWLVEQYVYLLLQSYRSVVELHLIGTKDLGTQLGNYLTIDSYQTSLDELISLTARANTSIGEELVQAQWLCWVDVLLLIFDTLLHAILSIWIVTRSVLTETATTVVAIATTLWTAITATVVAITTLLRTTIAATTVVAIAATLWTTITTTVVAITTLLRTRLVAALLAWLVATLLTRLITTLLIIIVVTRTIATLLRTRLIASLLTWLVATTVAVTITTTALIAAALWTLAAACTLQASTETFRTETAFAVTATSVAAVCAM